MIYLYLQIKLAVNGKVKTEIMTDYTKADEVLKAGKQLEQAQINLNDSLACMYVGMLPPPSLHPNFEPLLATA